MNTARTLFQISALLEISASSGSEVTTAKIRAGDGLYSLEAEIEKTIGKDPNTAKITIYNLASWVRSEILTKGAKVKLFAGYAGDLALCFSGEVDSVETDLQGVDRVTTVEAITGESAIRHARFNKSFGPGTDARTIVKGAIGSMGLKIPKNLDQMTALGDRFETGAAFSGSPAQALDGLTRRRGLSWSVQDDHVQILSAGGIRADEALVISEQSGMIGSPKAGAAKERGGKNTASAKALLEPRAIPGVQVKLYSKNVSGTFRALKVSHMISTIAECYTTLDLESL